MNKVDRHSKKFDEGFTLVEMLVVLVIVGLIAALATPQVLRYLGQAKVDAATAQIKNFESALELYFIDNGGYPSTQQGLSALSKRPENSERWNGPYLKTKGEFLDPWGNIYVYKLVSANDIEITSLGQDGIPGGEGLDTDIQN